MAVLVTGGAGYIGAHVAKALAAAGYRPVVLDDLSHGRRDFVRWGPLVVADLNEVAAVDAAFGAHAIDSVVHLAGLIDSAESVAHAARYQHVNVEGTRALLSVMERHSVRRLVFSSSASVYGQPATQPISESSPAHPLTPYGAGKLAVEGLLRAAGAASSLKSMALRFFNAAGADASAIIGEAHSPETHAVPLAIGAALGGPAFRVFGTDYKTPDGTAVRDFVHVSDLATAHVMALRALASGHLGGTFNLGSDLGTSVRELLAAVALELNRAVPSIDQPRRTGDAPVLVADSTRARTELGWWPLHSDLGTIVASATRWHMAQPLGSRPHD